MDIIWKGVFLLLFLVCAFIFVRYVNKNYSRNAQKVGLPAGFVNKGASLTIFPYGVSGMVAGKWLGDNHPLIGALLFLAIGLFLFFMNLPFAGSGFCMFAAVMCMAGFSKIVAPSFDFKTSKPFQFVGITLIILGLCLIGYESLPLFASR